MICIFYTPSSPFLSSVPPFPFHSLFSISPSFLSSSSSPSPFPSPLYLVQSHHLFPPHHSCHQDINTSEGQWGSYKNLVLHIVKTAETIFTTVNTEETSHLELRQGIQKLSLCPMYCIIPAHHLQGKDQHWCEIFFTNPARTDSKSYQEFTYLLQPLATN